MRCSASVLGVTALTGYRKAIDLFISVTVFSKVSVDAFCHIALYFSFAEADILDQYKALYIGVLNRNST